MRHRSRTSGRADERQMDEPSEAERRGLGDIGELGDPAETGQLGMDPEAETASEEALDTFAEGDLGASPPLTREEQGSGASRQTGGAVDQRKVK